MLPVLPADVPHQIAAETLFGDVLLHVDMAQDDRFEPLAECVEHLPARSSKHLFVQVPTRRLPPNHLADPWKLIEEPPVSTNLVPKALEWFARTDKSLADIPNRPALESAMRTWIGVGDIGLADFIGKLDLVLAVCLSPADRRFDAHAFRKIVGDRSPTDYYQWHDRTARMLTNPIGPARMSFLQSLDAALHRNTTAGPLLYGSIVRAAFDLFVVNDKANPGDGLRPNDWTDFRWRRLREHRDVPALHLLRWVTLLAGAEPDLHRGRTTDWAALLEAFAGPNA